MTILQQRRELIDRDENGKCNFSHHDDELKWEIFPFSPARPIHQCVHRLERAEEFRTSGGCDFHGEHDGHDEEAPEDSGLEISGPGDDHQDSDGSGIVGGYLIEGLFNVIAGEFAGLPGEDFGAEPVVAEPFGGVGEGVEDDLELGEEVGVLVGRLVWVESGGAGEDCQKRNGVVEKTGTYILRHRDRRAFSETSTGTPNMR